MQNDYTCKEPGKLKQPSRRESKQTNKDLHILCQQCQTEMLDFLDKDFKTAVITILWEVRKNILEMNEKREFLWKVIKATKWNKWKNP